MLMIGPPGGGKSMLAARLPGILPPLTPSEALDVSLVQSVAGLLPEAGIAQLRPFREPHHSASLAALIGGGARTKPGEVLLAHRGILFLDELPEFQRAALESLRPPLETARAVVARANAHITYPARFQLVAAMNPCRCGHLSDPALACSKAPRCAEDYQARISGPLFDRIDLHVGVPAVDPADLSLPAAGESSAAVRARVIKARARQADRFAAADAGDVRTTAEADGQLLTQICDAEPQAGARLDEAAQKFKLSARGYFRVLRVARTLADRAGRARVGRMEMAEALTYRRVQPRRGTLAGA